MARDEHVESRMRDALGGMVGISEKPMMGGLRFLLYGNMIGGADCTKDGERRFMFRIGKENQDQGMNMTGAVPMFKGNRKMSGFFWVVEENCDEKTLRNWIDLSLSFAAGLPAK